MTITKKLAVWLTASGVLFACAGTASESATSSEPPIAVDRSPLTTWSQAYLHGSGAVLTLDAIAPTATTAAIKDSAAVKFSGGNLWVDVGTWYAAPTLSNGILTALDDVRLWVGLKNSDDIGANFDLRVELYKNGVPAASGEQLCVRGITRNPSLATPVSVWFGAINPLPFDGTTDILSLRVATRMGTDGSGASCGGHKNAVGLRTYFDSATRPAALTMSLATGCGGNTPDADCPKIRCTTVARISPPPSPFAPPLWTLIEPDVKVYRFGPGVIDLYSTGLVRAQSSVPPVRFYSSSYPEVSNDYVATIHNVAPDLHDASIFGTTVNDFFQLTPFALTTRSPAPGSSVEYSVTCSGMTSVRTSIPFPPLP